MDNNKQLNSNKEILEELKKLLSQPENNDINYISLKSVYHLLNQKNIKTYIKNCENELYSLLNETFSDIYQVEIKTVNKNTFKFYIETDDDSKDRYKLNKTNNDWYINQNESANDCLDIIKLVGPIIQDFLSKTEKKLLISEKLKSNLKDEPFTIKNPTTNLDISFDSSGIIISSNDIFKLLCDIQTDNYQYQNVSLSVMNILNNNEENILKNIYLPIEEFPTWFQEILKRTREDELAKPKYIEHINDIKEKNNEEDNIEHINDIKENNNEEDKKQQKNKFLRFFKRKH